MSKKLACPTALSKIGPKSGFGRVAMHERGEIVERSFAHVVERELRSCRNAPAALRRPLGVRELNRSRGRFRGESLREAHLRPA
jgi:hypothetical protein